MVGKPVRDHHVRAGVHSDARSGDPAPWSGVGRRSRELHHRVFSAPSDSDRVRRPTDLVLLCVAVLGLVGLSMLAPGPTAADTAVSDFLAETKQPLSWLWALVYAALAGWTVVVLLISLVARGRKRLFLSEVIAVLIAIVVASVSATAVGGSWQDAVDASLATGPPPVYAAVRIAAAVAVLSTASTHLAATWRKVGRWLIAGGSLGAVALGAAYPIGVLAGLCAGAIAATTVHLLLGAPMRHLAADEIADALRGLAVDAHDLTDRGLDECGVDRLKAVRADGRALLVKVYARDSWDNQLLVSAWRALVWRDQFTVRRTTRQEQVEHEAAATLLAQQAGVAVVPVLAAGSTADGDGYLVLCDDGPTLADEGGSALSGAHLRGLWRTLHALHVSGTAHGSIDPDRLVVTHDGSIALTDLDRADLGATDDAMLRDDARLLVVSAVLVGRSAAVEAAVDVLGADRAAQVLPYVQSAVLSRATARAVEQLDWSMDELRADIAAKAGVEVPELEQLRRVSWASIGKLVLIGVLIYGLWTVFSGVSLDEVADELAGADWAWVGAALALSPLVQVPQAVSTIGACFRPLRLVPSLMLQYAVQFIALAIPSSAARVALEIRFFQKIGVPAAGAVSISVVDSISGFIIQIALLVIVFASGLVDVGGSVSSTGGSSTTADGAGIDWQVVLVAVVAVVAAFLFALLWSRFRAVVRRFVAVLRDRFSEGRDALQVVRDPSKLFLMFSGNLVAQLMYAFMLGLCLEAFGHSTSYANLILINTFVSLFAGFMPVPGGVGVAEAGLTYGLIAVGIPEAVAVSTAVCYRVVTFYLPPAWTWYGMRWLRAKDLL